MDVFGADLASGYDIGCRFKTTVKFSTLGERAKDLRHAFLVDEFHGFAHNRRCQVNHLTTYCKGLGLENLGNCERAFSKSNSLAARTRHMSVFRRRQAIDAYFSHQDTHEVWLNLSESCFYCILYYILKHKLGMFLYNNYRQALGILEDGQESLTRAMQDLNISDVTVFEEWLKEEKTYLEGLNREPEEETLQMEYWQALVNFAAAQYALIPTILTMVHELKSLQTGKRHCVESDSYHAQRTWSTFNRIKRSHPFN